MHGEPVASRARAVVTSQDVAPLLDVSGIDGLAVLTIESLREGPALAAPVRVPLSAPALLQFTSGSTAAPKGVVLTNRDAPEPYRTALAIAAIARRACGAPLPRSA